MRKLRIRCKCGRRISTKEILRHGIIMAHCQPLYAYVRYRCSRCKHVGEKLVDCRQWNKMSLGLDDQQSAERERKRLGKMGQIRTDELIEFVRGLKQFRLADLASLTR